jgi:hypothetical protein
VEAVVLGAVCRHLAGKVLDLLQKCGVVGGRSSELLLRCDLGDAIRTGGCSVQAALVLTGEIGLYVEGGAGLTRWCRGSPLVRQGQGP